LPDLKFPQAINNERADDESGEQGSEAGKRCAKRDVAKNAERRDVVLQLEK
jgi:hypothetical protein